MSLWNALQTAMNVASLSDTAIRCVKGLPFVQELPKDFQTSQKSLANLALDLHDFVCSLEPARRAQPEILHSVGKILSQFGEAIIILSKHCGGHADVINNELQIQRQGHLIDRTCELYSDLQVRVHFFTEASFTGRGRWWAYNGSCFTKMMDCISTDITYLRNQNPVWEQVRGANEEPRQTNKYACRSDFGAGMLADETNAHPLGSVLQSGTVIGKITVTNNEADGEDNVAGVRILGGRQPLLRDAFVDKNRFKGKRNTFGIYYA